MCWWFQHSYSSLHKIWQIFSSKKAPFQDLFSTIIFKEKYWAKESRWKHRHCQRRSRLRDDIVPVLIMELQGINKPLSFTNHNFSISGFFIKNRLPFSRHFLDSNGWGAGTSSCTHHPSAGSGTFHLGRVANVYINKCNKLPDGWKCGHCIHSHQRQ